MCCSSKHKIWLDYLPFCLFVSQGYSDVYMRCAFDLMISLKDSLVIHSLGLPSSSRLLHILYPLFPHTYLSFILLHFFASRAESGYCSMLRIYSVSLSVIYYFRVVLYDFSVRSLHLYRILSVYHFPIIIASVAIPMLFPVHIR